MTWTGIITSRRIVIGKFPFAKGQKHQQLIGVKMNRSLVAAVALVGTVASAGAALAQAYPPTAYNPAYNTYYPQYAAPPAPPPAYYAPGAYPYPYYYDGTHSSGGASRAYGWGQKTN
jgi:hypothetical protein